MGPEGISRPESEAEKLSNAGQIPDWAGHYNDYDAQRAMQESNLAPVMRENARINAAANAAEANQSADDAAQKAMAAAFGPAGMTTRFGQEPLQAGSFKPEHFESTLEQNLVEPAFDQPMPTEEPDNPFAAIASRYNTAAQTGIRAMQGAPNQNAGWSTPGSADAVGAIHLGGTPFSPPNADVSQATPGPINVTQPAFPHTPTPTGTNVAPQQTNIPMPPTRPAELGPSATSNNIFDQINAANLQMANGIMGAPKAIASGIGNMFFPSQHYDPLTGQSRPGMSPFIGGGNTPEAGNQGGGADQVTPAKSKTRMIQKLMPDGTYQWVEEPYKKGGRVYRRTVNSQMTDHVISKFGARLPASKQQPIGSKAGRR
jgi:hypothetical protein